MKPYPQQGGHRGGRRRPRGPRLVLLLTRLQGALRDQAREVRLGQKVEKRRKPENVSGSLDPAFFALLRPWERRRPWGPWRALIAKSALLGGALVQEPGLQRHADELRPAGDVELLLDVRPVGLDRAHRDVEALRDLGIG